MPAAFKAWLTDPDTGKIRRNKHTRVTFGPNDGFVAWDSTSIRWSKIPEGLEGVLQGWLSPAGWSGGPPRIIALGKDQAYLAISEYGVWAYRNLPGDMRAEMTMCGKDLEKIKVRCRGFVEHSIRLLMGESSVQRLVCLVPTTSP